MFGTDNGAMDCHCLKSCLTSTLVPALQQLYLYLGFLLVNSVINLTPLKTLAKVAKIGVVWHFTGLIPSITSVLTAMLSLMQSLSVCPYV